MARVLWVVNGSAAQVEDAIREALSMEFARSSPAQEVGAKVALEYQGSPPPCELRALMHQALGIPSRTEPRRDGIDAIDRDAWSTVFATGITIEQGKSRGSPAA